MCLFKKSYIPRIAFKDKVVYKIFIKDKDLYSTPFQRYNCEIGDIIKSNKSFIKGLFKRTIHGEGVHAYKNYTEAYWNKFCIDAGILNRVVIGCIIPKFTPYWLGKGNEIAAGKIKLVKEI